MNAVAAPQIGNIFLNVTQGSQPRPGPEGLPLFRSSTNMTV